MTDGNRPAEVPEPPAPEPAPQGPEPAKPKRKRGGTGPTAVVSLRIPRDSKKRLERYARQHGISVTAAGVACIEKGLDALDSPFALSLTDQQAKRYVDLGCRETRHALDARFDALSTQLDKVLVEQRLLAGALGFDIDSGAYFSDLLYGPPAADSGDEAGEGPGAA